jgi:hypothetical protein
MVDAVTQTKISTELTTPLTVPPPTGGLGSNSNYVLSSNPSSQCTPITGLTVTIDITQDLVLKSSTSFFVNGYSIQLNCSSPPGFINAWQQFVFLIYTPDIGYSELDVAVNDYTVKEDELLNDLDTVLRLPSNTLPAGYQLQIQLKTDANNNVVGAQYVVNDIGFPPTLTTPLTGYTLPDTSAPNNYRTPTEQHINYIGIDGHIHERFHRAEGNWIHNDLSVIAGSSIFPAANSALDAYADLDLGQHVNFIGTDGHVHKLYIRPKGQWINNDLIMLSGNGITPSRTSPLSGYMAQDNGQHVNFIGTDGHVHELYNLHSAQWLNNDLTQLAQLSGPSVPPAPDSKLCGYWAWSDGKQHVNFTGTDGHVHDLSIAPNGQWTNSDLTQLSGPSSATPASDGALHSYPQPNGDLHVNFIGVNDAHLHELLLGPLAQWVDNDLNNIPLANFLKSPLGLSPNQIAPINAFELDLVGPGDGANAVFSSGAGTFIYAAATPMTVQSCLPPCTGTTEGAAETSNSVYGDLDAGPSIVITQTFSIDPTERVIRRQGPVFKLPLKPGETLKPIPVPQQA